MPGLPVQRRCRRFSYRWFKGVASGCLAVLSLVLTIALHLPPTHSLPAPTPPTQVAIAIPEFDGRAAFQAGRFQEAVTLFEQAIADYTAQGDTLRQAMVWGNLALAHQQLGNWPQANEAIATSLALLSPEATDADSLTLRAQALDVQGQLLLNQGEAEAALHHWEAAARLYDELGNLNGQLQSQLYQAQALQSLGFYRRAVDLLRGLRETLEAQSDPRVKVGGLQSLGEALRVSGNLEGSQEVLADALAIATQLSLSDALPGLHLSLGNTLQALGQTEDALAEYQQASRVPSAVQLRAQLNQFRLLVETGQAPAALALAQTLLPQIKALPPSRPHIYAKINFVETATRLSGDHALELPVLAELLAIAVQEAQTLSDRRAESYALGTLGALYEQNRQFSEAEALTRQAWEQAEQIKANDIGYRWLWQLGRVLKVQNQRQPAIAAYTDAFNLLQQLRSDLAAASTDVQFSFQKRVAPVYRELVDLLLTPDETTQAEIRQAREVMEALQVAELENFFQEACPDTTQLIDRVVDEEDRTAAVLYPILLPNRLELIVKFPEQADLYRYSNADVSRDEIEQTIKELRENLPRSDTFQQVKLGGQLLYDWLIRPVREQLDAEQMKTLIFVLDGPLRTIPMAALHDGDRYLIESFAFNLLLGLEVRDPTPLPDEAALHVLAASLSDPPPEFRNQFAKLEFVNDELDVIDASSATTTLLRDDAFTRTAFNQSLNQEPFQVVHLATHGQFGSDRRSTFILAADGKIGIDGLSELFRNEGQVHQVPVELLILSACQTATGDEREVLGIAGTTVRAGARSAIATLWGVDDESSARFAEVLYQYLGQPGVNRAEAMRQAQLALLQNPNYEHPRFWAPYILVGSWL